FQRGWPDSGEDDCHGEKRWMTAKLQQWGMAPTRYPHRSAIASMQIGDLALVGLPFETTFEAANRNAGAVIEPYGAAGQPPRQVVVSSHANGFFGYSATREEYAAQWYEGGHTLYGPATTSFLATESAKLVTDMLR